SPMFGALKPSDLIFRYSVTFADRIGEKTLKAFWKENLKNLSEKLLSGAIVYDFLTKDQRQTLTYPESATVVRFDFFKGDKRVVNPMPHRAYTLRYIAERGLSLDEIDKINFYDYKVVSTQRRGNEILVILRGEGKYL
ncbi:MAG: hypothetical protein GXO04_06625, partial [Aquificae bacterium]|nr:hypothetical protein [Aquificota bacterium]